MTRLGDLVSPQTAAAVRRHAARLDSRVMVGESHIELRDDEVTLAEVHRDEDGRWVLASWDERAAQYTGSSPDGLEAMGTAYRCTYGRTLAAIRALGVPAYRSPAAALATVEPERAMRPPGRPTLPNGRRELIQVKVSPEEKSRCERAANAASLPLPEWVRSTLLAAT